MEHARLRFMQKANVYVVMKWQNDNGDRSNIRHAPHMMSQLVEWINQILVEKYSIYTFLIISS